MSLGNIFQLHNGTFNGPAAKPINGGMFNSPGFNSSGSSSSSSSSQVAGLQVPKIGSVELPDWLKGSADSQLAELMQTYGDINTAFDPTGQVQARNDAIGYNTSAGSQAANNAATEFSNRAAQSGASQLGAGVVKAQAMLPVLSSNAQLRTQAADVAAKAHQDAVGLAAQVANTIGNLRQSYLQTLTGYATGQQQMQLQNSQFNAGQAQNQSQFQQGLNLDQQKFNYQKQLDQQQLLAQQQQRQFAMQQAQAQPRTSTPGKISPLNYSVNPTGLGMGTNIGFADPYIYGNQQPGSLYQQRASQQLGGMF